MPKRLPKPAGCVVLSAQVTPPSGKITATITQKFVLALFTSPFVKQNEVEKIKDC